MLRAVQSPHLPRALEHAHLDDLVHGEELIGRDIDGDIVGCHAERVEITESRLSRVRATGSDLTRLRLRDVLLEGCDLSGAMLEEAPSNVAASSTAASPAPCSPTLGCAM